jgi:hypothetical protein
MPVDPELHARLHSFLSSIATIHAHEPAFPSPPTKAEAEEQQQQQQHHHHHQQQQQQQQGNRQKKS